MKCVNCGADVHGSICEYCGTSYGKKKIENDSEEPVFNFTGRVGTINLFGEQIRAYVSEVVVESCNEITTHGRDEEGQIYHIMPRTKRKFTLIEI